MDWAFWEEVAQWLAIGILWGLVWGRRRGGASGIAGPDDQIRPRNWGNPL